MTPIFRRVATALAACFLLAGCSGLDDLQVTNRFGFVVELHRDSPQGAKLATLAPGETGSWSGEGGHKGEAAERFYCTANGKSLGLLGKVGHDIQRESNGSLNGSGTLTVIIGP